MDLNNISQNRCGQSGCINCCLWMYTVSHCCVPDPLPPRWHWTLHTQVHLLSHTSKYLPKDSRRVTILAGCPTLNITNSKFSDHNHNTVYTNWSVYSYPSNRPVGQDDQISFPLCGDLNLLNHGIPSLTLTVAHHVRGNSTSHNSESVD